MRACRDNAVVLSLAQQLAAHGRIGRGHKLVPVPQKGQQVVEMSPIAVNEIAAIIFVHIRPERPTVLCQVTMEGQYLSKSSKIVPGTAVRVDRAVENL